jgi:outer membrane cobalamin receptor
VPDGATPWPEAKLTVGWQPVDMVEITVIGARKGRVPTLRERYQLNIGNDELEPETSTSADVGVTVKPHATVVVKVVGFDREVDQMIRLDVPSAMLINIGKVSLRGLDASVDVTPVPLVSTGVSWAYIDASSEGAGDEPLDFLPHNRLDGHVTLKLRARAGFTGRVRWIDERIDAGTTLPAYVTADASGFYRFRKDLRGTLKVDNLADDRHELRANGYRDPGRVIMLGVEGVWE